MKKTFLKILAIAGTVLAVMFVVILLVAIFGGIGEKEFDNSLVKGLFITLGILYFLLAGTLIAVLFINDDIAKEIVLTTGSEGATRTTVGVVKKIAKETVALTEGVKCTKCSIVSNEFGVRLKVTVKAKDRDVGDVEKYIRPILEDAYMGKLGYKFYSIEIKVAKLKSKYQVNTAKIIAEADEKAKIADEQASGSLDQTAPVETPVEPVEEPTPDEVVEETPVESDATEE